MSGDSTVNQGAVDSSQPPVGTEFIDTGQGWRDLWFLLSGSSVTRLGAMSASTALPLLAMEKTESPMFAGFLTAAMTLPDLVFYLPAGLLADRWDRRQIMFVSQAARAALVLVLIWAVAMLRDPAVLIAATILAMGVFATFYYTAEAAAVPHMAPPEKLLKAVSRNEVQSQGSVLLGKQLGGALFSISPWLPFVADLAGSVASLFTLRKIDKNRLRLTSAQDAGRPKSFEQIRENLEWLRTDPFTRRSLLVCAITNFLFQTVLLLLVVLATNQELPGVLIGLILASSGIGGAIGAFAAPWVLRRIRLGRTTVTCSWAWFLLTAILLVSNHPAVLLFVWAGIGFVGAHMNVALGVYHGTVVPPDKQGLVAGFRSFVMRVPAALGALGGGMLISMLDTVTAALSVAIAMLAIAMLVTLRSARSKTEDHPNIDRAVTVFEGGRYSSSTDGSNDDPVVNSAVAREHAGSNKIPADTYDMPIGRGITVTHVHEGNEGAGRPVTESRRSKTPGVRTLADQRDTPPGPTRPVHPAAGGGTAPSVADPAR